METIAVYWEENIRTYGIQLEKNLCLARADILPGQLAELGRQIAELGQDETRFRLILAHAYEPDVLSLSMVFREPFRQRLSEISTRPLVKDLSCAFAIHVPVEMLCFHGPHFGDRYGIAHMAGHALQKKNIRYIVMGCSAASVHILFPENAADKAKMALASVFQTP
jgi:aspartokinase